MVSFASLFCSILMIFVINRYGYSFGNCTICVFRTLMNKQKHTVVLKTLCNVSETNCFLVGAIYYRLLSFSSDSSHTNIQPIEIRQTKLLVFLEYSNTDLRILSFTPL